VGDWSADQSKSRKRYQWVSTRGEKDQVWRDFTKRLKSIPDFNDLRIEKLGPEIHFWRETKDSEGKTYWTSCLRFSGDNWDYWTVYWRADESRWRSTGIKDVPVSQALTQAVAFYNQKKHEFL